MMFTKIDIRPIIGDHLNTLKDSAGKRLRSDIILFYGLPIIVAVALVWVGVGFSDAYIDFLLIAQTIVIPLLFNVLFLIYNIKDHHGFVAPEEPRQRSLWTKRMQFLEDIYKNLSYLILVSLVSVLVLGEIKVVGVKYTTVQTVDAASPVTKDSASTTPAGTAKDSSAKRPTWPMRVCCVVAYALLLHIALTGLMIMKRTHVLLTDEVKYKEEKSPTGTGGQL